MSLNPFSDENNYKSFISLIENSYQNIFDTDRCTINSLVSQSTIFNIHICFELYKSSEDFKIVKIGLVTSK